MGRGPALVLCQGVSCLFSCAMPGVRMSAESDDAVASSLEDAEPLRILLVDDDPLVLQSLRDILSAEGHEIATADGGQAAIDAFLVAQKNGAPFTAVVTDLGMPYVDGRQVASAIKSAAPSTVVVMLTGWGQRLVAEGDVPPHVDRVVSKPPKLRELHNALADAWHARIHSTS
jgi:CheY-like chemotaxis protein